MRAIFYGGRLAALAAGERVVFCPRIEVLEPDHPLRRFVSAVCLWSCELDARDVPVRFDPVAAEVYARALLMPAELFAALARELPDDVIAEDLNVPLEQVALRRADLVAERAARGCRRGTWPPGARRGRHRPRAGRSSVNRRRLAPAGEGS